MGDVNIKEVSSVERLRIGEIAPAAVHIKELNHVDPISVESLRVDDVRNVEPLRVERLDVTRLPTVNLSVGRLPQLDLNVRRVPPVAIGVNQDFCLPSEYTIQARLLGFEFLRLNVHGRTMVRPQSPVHRERVRTHERSFADVAAVGNPGIPVRREVREMRPIVRPCPSPPPARASVNAPPGHAFRGWSPGAGMPAVRPASWRQHAQPALRAGAPHFSYGMFAPRSAIETGSVSCGAR